jgi:hypothetical protein
MNNQKGIVTEKSHWWSRLHVEDFSRTKLAGSAETALKPWQ